jgi:putative tricarboxylic transport membrane protein
MATDDRVSTIFILGFALFICVESYRLGPGSFSQPGPGFLPLGAGLVIGVFSLLLLAGAGRKKDAEKKPSPGRIAWGKAAMTLGSLLGYAALLNVLGFHLVNVLWMAFVCRGMGKMRWGATLALSFGSTFLTYFLFEYYLSIRFPRGVLGI